MKKIRASSENEMIFEFLLAEIKSERYSGQIYMALKSLGIDEKVILNGNMNDPEENVRRRKILGLFRGYGENRGLFEDFPANVAWELTEFENLDLPKIRYINYSYWNEISNYTGSPLEAAKTIRAGNIIFGVPNDGFLEALESLEKGVKFPPLIMLTDCQEKFYTVLEGHKRMTAYALKPELFDNINVILGYCGCGEIEAWYGEMPAPGSMTL